MLLRTYVFTMNPPGLTFTVHEQASALSSVVHCHACFVGHAASCVVTEHTKSFALSGPRVNVPKPRETKQGVKCIGKSIIEIVQKKSLFPSGRYGFCEDGWKKKQQASLTSAKFQKWEPTPNWRIRRRRARNWITRRAKRSGRSGAFALTGCLILQILWSEYLFCQDISF